MADFQDLDHLDGLAISVVSQTYIITTETILTYFISGMVECGSVYTQSKVISENIK